LIGPYYPIVFHPPEVTVGQITYFNGTAGANEVTIRHFFRPTHLSDNPNSLAGRAERRRKGANWNRGKAGDHSNAKILTGRGMLVQAASRMIKEEVTFSNTNVTSLDWNSYPCASRSVPPSRRSLCNAWTNPRAAPAKRCWVPRRRPSPMPCLTPPVCGCANTRLTPARVLASQQIASGPPSRSLGPYTTSQINFSRDEG
jgi:hypothetical protein